MKAGLAMAACIALALPAIVLAAPAAPALLLLTPADLGGLLSVVEVCEDVTPNQREQLRKNAKELMNGLSEDRIEAMKLTPDFKSAYATIAGILKGIPKDQTIQICGQFARVA